MIYKNSICGFLSIISLDLCFSFNALVQKEVHLKLLPGEFAQRVIRAKASQHGCLRTK